MDLTDEQTAILRHRTGPALVTAGAGCGKTTLLLEYIEKILPKQSTRNLCILVLTFNKSACEELMRRLEERETPTNGISRYNNVQIRTYHAFGYALVRQHYDKLGLQEPPSDIANTDLIKECVAEVVIHSEDHDNSNLNSNVLVARKLYKKQQKELLKAVMSKRKKIANGQPSTAKSAKIERQIKKVLQLYKQKKVNQNLVDFDDMVGLLMGNMGLIAEAAGNYNYLLVDELQDTNVQQTKMLIALARNIKTSVMVGDPKQNLYEFRGAYAGNWDTIKVKLQPREYTLTKTHRIPDASLPFINAIGDEIYPGARLTSEVTGLSVRLVHCQSSGDQAQFIADKINWLIDEKKARADQIVCLGRTQRILSNLSVALEGHGITTKELFRAPHSKHEKGLRNLLRLTRWLRQQSNAGIHKFEFPEKCNQVLSSWLERLGADASAIDNIFNKMPKKGWKAVRVTSRINGKEQPDYRRILKFRKLIAKAAESDEPEKAISYLMDALRVVLRRMHKDRRTVDYLMRDLTQLQIKIRQFASWEDLSVKELKLNNTQNNVRLSTINGAKGKEWQYVFVIHCVNGILPLHHAKTDSELDTEKKLLYVASTRHKKGLYLMDAPGSVVVYGTGKNKQGRSDVTFSGTSSLILHHKKHLKVLNTTT